MEKLHNVKVERPWNLYFKKGKSPKKLVKAACYSDSDAKVEKFENYFSRETTYLLCFNVSSFIQLAATESFSPEVEIDLFGLAFGHGCVPSSAAMCILIMHEMQHLVWARLKQIRLIWVYEAAFCSFVPFHPLDSQAFIVYFKVILSPKIT